MQRHWWTGGNTGRDTGALVGTLTHWWRHWWTGGGTGGDIGGLVETLVGWWRHWIMVETLLQ